jgi:hypothetical protein
MEPMIPGTRDEHDDANSFGSRVPWAVIRTGADIPARRRAVDDERGRKEHKATAVCATRERRGTSGGEKFKISGPGAADFLPSGGRCDLSGNRPGQGMAQDAGRRGPCRRGPRCSPDSRRADRPSRANGESLRQAVANSVNK